MHPIQYKEWEMPYKLTLFLSPTRKKRWTCKRLFSCFKYSFNVSFGVDSVIASASITTFAFDHEAWIFTNTE